MPTQCLLRNTGYADPINDTDSPLYAAAAAGHADCVELLFATGMMKASAANAEGRERRCIAQSSSAGHLRVVQTLSCHGSHRSTRSISEMFGNVEPEPELEVLAREHGHTEVAEFLECSREWTPRHHLEVLSAD